ncbi:hypothetical protein ILUMI_17415 [Ignelater luminosus]|uniref:Uncharacterized protein n=1 Tax=Ignelater luminosus TaxID=2038154 RepID=A0A8K0CJX6_IGNLU|nr:hypothetical protein ILUMI_17415 [Ignelater luminosus]
MFYKVNYTDNYESFPKRLTTKNKNFVIPPLFISQPKIKKEKYDHLQSLKSVLDKQYWDFYDNLLH